MWRCDPNRSGSTAEQLPRELHLQWVLRRPPLAPAWPDEPRMRFDAIYQPIVMGRTMFLASSHSDSVTAVDVRSGAEKWRFHAEGPVRFAPAGWRDAIFFTCDDGHLYCLDAATGSLRWKFRGYPGKNRMVLGNERLISAWPARGGPVVRDGTVYFAAGIWPFIGVFVYALDAESGEAAWCNDSSGSLYIKQPHNSPAFAGLAPQGYLVATDEKLLVPNGRAAAAGLDRRTGKFLYFHHAENKRFGHSEVAAVGSYFVNSGRLTRLTDGRGVIALVPSGENVGFRYSKSSIVLYDKLTGEELAPVGAVGILAGGVSYQSGGDVIVARDLRQPITRVVVDRRGRKSKHEDLRVIWELATRAKPMLRAGNRLYAADGHEIAAFDLAGRETMPELPGDPNDQLVVFGEDRLAPPPQLSWRTKVQGTPAAMIAAGGRLFVVTREGGIYCYGERKVAEPAVIESELPPPGEAADGAGAEPAASILRTTGVAEGYCLVMGMADGHLAEQLVRQSKLRVIVVDADAGKIAAFRRRLDLSGPARSRLAAIVADPRTAPLPPYLAGLMVCEDPNALGPVEEAPVEKLFGMLRPYGGTACVALAEEDRRRVVERIRAARLAGAEVAQVGRWTLLSRKGPLPGAGSWTHQYGSGANTCVSDDDLVRAPLGLLWFGGVSNQGILPRHGHGPPEQIIGGRLFIEGPDLLRALDVYTGRLLWQRRLEDVGQYYNYTSHEPGAGALGTNYVATRDAVYVVHDRKCLLLAPATGKTVGRFVLPGGDGEPNHAPHWGYIGVWQDLLVAGSAPMKFWRPEFHADEFRRAGRRTGAARPSQEQFQTLVEAVLTWEDFEVEQPPKFVFAPPGVTEIEKGPTTQPAGAVPFILVNLNKLLHAGGILSKLPAAVVAAARERGARAVARWDAARRLDDYFDEPKPDNVDDLHASVRMLLASPRRELDDGRDVTMLRRQILEHCYRELPRASKPEIGSYTIDHTASREIVVMDRRTGEVLWRRPAAAAFRHNSICLGGGKLFCIDRVPTRITSRMLRRGVKPKTTDVLLALDLRTGKTIWSTTRGVFGTWLSYSADHDILIQAARPSRDMLKDESDKRIVAYRGKTGEVLWDRKDKKFDYSGPCMLHGRTLITQGAGLDLLSGKDKTRTHPLTGEEVEWEFKRNYGCNHVIASRHLLTFRSAAAGFYDLAGDSGTGNLGGFKSGCTSNLIAADGVLNAPEYTRTCTCSYQNQCSVALIHMPGVEMWTFQDLDRGKRPIRRAGINLGAPGDRLAADGTLWLEYPFVGGPSPGVEISTDPKRCAYFRRHPSNVAGEGLRWVAASGIESPAKITIKLASSKSLPRTYTVRLHFAEPGRAKKGQRLFHVAIMGRTVLRNFDVAAEAGAPLTPVVKVFRRIAVKDKLLITLAPAEGAGIARPVLCGVEVVAEK